MKTVLRLYKLTDERIDYNTYLGETFWSHVLSKNIVYLTSFKYLAYTKVVAEFHEPLSYIISLQSLVN
jgi:hypothetical protein